METTLRHLLRMEEFRDFRILAGANGLDRTIKTVNIMDAPDIDEWIRGGEIILSTGYLFKEHPEDLAGLLERIHSAGASALFLKVDRFLGKVPQTVLDKADALCFPLIYVPKKLPFVDIIDPVLTTLLNQRNRAIQHYEDVHRQFTDIAMRGDGIEAVVQTLASFLKVTVVYADTVSDRVYTSDAEPLPPDFLQTFSTRYPHQSIYIQSKLYGYLVVMRPGEFQKDDTIPVEHAVTVIRLYLQSQLAAMQREDKYRTQFVEDLLFRNVKSLESVERRAALLGWKTKGCFRVVVADVEPLRHKFSDEPSRFPAQMVQTLTRKMQQTFEQVMYTQFGDTLAMIVSEKESRQTVDTLLSGIAADMLAEYRQPVLLAGGRRRESILEVDRSFSEARKALDIAKKIRTQEPVVLYECMGIYTFLDNVAADENARKFCREYIGRLLDYDQRHHTLLFDTLTAVIDCGWNLKETSQKGYVHYNTIKYRYHKIEEVLGVNLDKTEEKLSVELAVKMLRMQNSGKTTG